MSTSGETDDDGGTYYGRGRVPEESLELKRLREMRQTHEQIYGFSGWSRTMIARESRFLKGESILVRMDARMLYPNQLIAVPSDDGDRDTPPTHYYIAKVVEVMDHVAMVLNTGRICPNPTFYEDIARIASDDALTPIGSLFR